MTQTQSELFAELRRHLHAGGTWWYTWASDGKRSSWAQVGKDAAKIPGAKNIYFGVHATNAKRESAQRSRIADVAAVNCLFAELDAKDYNGSKADALTRLEGLPLPPSAIVDSGGGFHAYWLLRETFALTNEEERKRAQTLQANWVAYVGGDLGAKDLARVLRVPGTKNLKPERKDANGNFPDVTFIRADFQRRYTLAELEGAAKTVAAYNAQRAAPTVRASTNGRGKYIEAAIRGEVANVTSATEGARNHTLNKAAFALGTLRAAGLDRGVAEGALLAAARACGLTEREAVRSIRSGLDAGEKEPRAIPEHAEAVAVAAERAERASGHNLTDLGNAERFTARHGANVRYCYTWGKWLVWDSRRWTPDENGEIIRRAKNTVRAIYQEAAALEDTAARKALADWARRSEGEGRINAMIALAQSEPGIGVTLAQLNADPWLLNCANGTLDLRTGELREPAREDLLTKLAPAAYEPNARSATWDRFLEYATGGSVELQTFLCAAAGYSLTGSTREEVLFFVHGPAAAGKSTFIEGLRATLGDYATTADFETFLARAMVGGARNDIARLAGARFVASIEVDEGKRLAEGLIKGITGGDTVAARFLYHESFEFSPAFKLWLAANHAPKVRDDDDAIWRRILRVPFEKVVPRAERDPKIKEELRDPAQGGAAILAWAVRGCLAWQAFGLTVPAIVENATNAYRADMDPLKNFFADRCVFGAEYHVTSKELRAAYEAWAEENGERYTLGANKFAERLKARGCETDHTRAGRTWRGLGLTTQEDEK